MRWQWRALTLTTSGLGEKYRTLSPAQRQELKKLYEEEIKLAETSLAQAQQLVQVGALPTEAIGKHQSELTELKRELLLVDGLAAQVC